MKIREPYHLPPDKQELNRRAQKLEWVTIGFLISIVIVMYLTMSSSQAMKAAWIEDTLSLIPPITFLISCHFKDKSPNERFPYGYRRAASIAFLAASVALFMIGFYILFDSSLKLITREHPTIGTIKIFGHHIWSGWLMITALIYGAIPPMILGYKKFMIAPKIHEKVLRTDAEMNKADWFTTVAGVLGILGIGQGWWWADSVAAGVISFEILKDGIVNIKESAHDLMDRKSVDMEGNSMDDFIEDLRSRLRKLDGVADADLRLREEGDTLAGEIFVVPTGQHILLGQIEQAHKLIRSSSWRFSDIVVTPVRSLK